MVHGKEKEHSREGETEDQQSIENRSEARKECREDLIWRATPE